MTYNKTNNSTKTMHSFVDDKCIDDDSNYTHLNIKDRRRKRSPSKLRSLDISLSKEFEKETDIEPTKREGSKWTNKAQKENQVVDKMSSYHSYKTIINDSPMVRRKYFVQKTIFECIIYCNSRETFVAFNF